MGTLREATAALLFFGLLAQRPDLQESAAAAVAELAKHGFRVPSEESPVRVFPALTSREFSAIHAGGWRPGTIYLRQSTGGNVSDGVYLRHELYHEASYLTCRGRLPRWAEEAGAMHFSGELAFADDTLVPGEASISHLKVAVSTGGAFTQEDMKALAHLTKKVDWPEAPCAVSHEMASQLGAELQQGGDFAYVLVSAVSGRMYESAGNLTDRYPPGSLLKIPYAASLISASPVDLAAELVRSDTAKLLQRYDRLDAERYLRLLSPAGSLRSDVLTARGALLGERNERGSYPFTANLGQLAMIMRASLLSHPSYFTGLRWNGAVPDSTLATEDLSDKALLRDLDVLAKTGTASDERGHPLSGHLLVAWPADHPLYLAVFRQRGVKGAAVLHNAAVKLREWRRRYSPAYGSVRVKLLSLIPKGSWQVSEDCPTVEGEASHFSLCGRLKILSSARGSRSERQVVGAIATSADGSTILETDGETYADAVLEAEAQGLTGSARQAMRAVIRWNGAHGNHRHGASSSLCDTSHCMVFLGLPVGEKAVRGGSEPALTELLDRLAEKQSLSWLPFASGGDERWESLIAGAELAQRLGESEVLSVRRELRRDGGVQIHLVYPNNEDVLSCEIFRNAFKLPSCPDKINLRSKEGQWLFSGLGAGHGFGLSLARAKSLTQSGRTAEEILMDAYSSAKVAP